ncbi:hypothetical protein [Sphingomonas mucosissima]|uniref:Uncharacterized protein n=1 Tax=Sphingomonas mucosissima TaxID=370959 RepID=A0A245ZLC6_9SPHN|nr:hypothetical protein [Sphingomonas mucosissima]OWK30525.1 hypothetical protein SPMU_15120 [Sphingomonas mucosissima]
MADPDTRLYGMADSANRQEPAENGMRGEGAADRETKYSREVTTPDHSTIVVEEESGVAFAEASGAVTPPSHEEAPQADADANAPQAGADLLPIHAEAPPVFADPAPVQTNVQPIHADLPRIYPIDDRSPAPEAPSPWPWIVVAVVTGYLVGKSRRRRAEAVSAEATNAPAALTRLPGEEGSFVQVRNAGLEEVRDPPAQWSRIDETLDESFPASDPPAY